MAIEEPVNMLGDAGDQPAVVPLDMLPKPASRRAGIDDSPMSGNVPMSLPQVQSVPPMSGGSHGTTGSRRASGLRQHRTLEEMYALNQEKMALGDFKLRVERLSPKVSYLPSGERVFPSGIIAHETRPIETEEFARKYGGLVYNVYLSVPHRSREMPNGSPYMVDVAFTEVRIPGDPNLEVLPITDAVSFGDENMYAQSPFGRRANWDRQQQPQSSQSPDAGVVKEVLNFAANAGRQPAQQASGDVIGAMAEQNKAAMQTAVTLTQQQVQMFQDQIKRLERQNEEYQRRMEEQRKEPSEFEKTMQVLTAMKTTGSADQVEVLTRRHAEDMAAEDRRHRAEVDALTRAHESAMERSQKSFESEQRRMEERIRDMQLTFDRERNALKDESERRERAAKQEVEVKFELMKEQLNGRIKDMELSHDREVRQLKDAHEKEIRATERFKDGDLRVNKETTAVQITVMQQEMARLQSENDRLKSENDDFRAKINRPLPEQLSEIRANAEMLGIGQDKDEKPSLAEKAISLLVNNPGPAIQAVSAVAQRVAPSLMGGGASQPQQMQQGQPQPRQLQAQQQPRRERPRMVFAEDDAPRTHVEDGRAQRRAEVRQPEMQASEGAQRPMQQNQAPAAGSAPSAQVQSQQQVEQQRFEQPAEAPAPQPQGQWSGLEWTGLPEENLRVLFNYLENSYSEGKTPAAVAQEMHGQHGPDIVKLVLATIQIEKLVEGVSVAPATKDTALATRKGKKFLQYVWSELGKLVA